MCSKQIKIEIQLNYKIENFIINEQRTKVKMDASKFILPLNVQNVTEKKPTKIANYLQSMALKNAESAIKKTVTIQLNATPNVEEMEDGVSASIALFLLMSLADGAFAIYFSMSISSTIFKMMSSWLYVNGMVTVVTVANGVLYWARRHDCINGLTSIVHFFMSWVVVIWVIFGWNEFLQMKHHSDIIKMHTIYSLLRMHLLFQTVFALVSMYVSYRAVKNMFEQAVTMFPVTTTESIQMKTPVK
jgi:hypothetical protein